jgi:hypothetical protein
VNHNKVLSSKVKRAKRGLLWQDLPFEDQFDSAGRRSEPLGKSLLAITYSRIGVKVQSHRVLVHGAKRHLQHSGLWHFCRPAANEAAE